jgi:hypothetical protein
LSAVAGAAMIRDQVLMLDLGDLPGAARPVRLVRVEIKVVEKVALVNNTLLISILNADFDSRLFRLILGFRRNFQWRRRRSRKQPRWWNR